MLDTNQHDAYKKEIEVDHHRHQIEIRDEEIAGLRNEREELNTKVASLRRIANDTATEASILLPIVLHYWTRAVEVGDTSEFVEAVKYSLEDTGIDTEIMLSRLEINGISLESEDFEKEYVVTIRIPVDVSLYVQAIGEDDAEVKAIDAVQDEGIDRYDMDYDVSFDGEVVEVREI